MRRFYQWCSDNIVVLCIVAIAFILLTAGGFRCSVHVSSSDASSTKGTSDE